MVFKKVAKPDAEIVNSDCDECGAPAGSQCREDCPNYIELETE